MPGNLYGPYDNFDLNNSHVIPALVRKFYEANYRPERTTLIVVGDFDSADVESRIKALFSDWRNQRADLN